MRLSDDVSRRLDRSDLGPVEAIHSYSSLRTVFLIIDIVFVVPALALLAASALKPALLGAALIFAVVAVPLTIGWWLARWPRRMVVVCQNGFADVQAGLVYEVIPWDAVHSLSLGNRGPNRITYGKDNRTFDINRGGLRLAHRCARELTARGRPAPAVPPIWAITCLLCGIVLPWLLIAPGLTLNREAHGAGLVVLIGGIPLIWGMAGLRRNVAASGSLAGKGAARIANIGCLMAGIAIITFPTLILPTIIALKH